MLGISILWKNPSPGVYIHLDLLVTLLNRESFTENQYFQLPDAQFFMSHENITECNTTNGNHAFISIADLLSHRPRYVDTNGEFQIEVRLSNIRTFFQNHFNISSRINMINGNQNGSGGSSFDYEAMEVTSETFVYGGFAWKAIVSPHPQLITPSWASTVASMNSSNKKTLKQFSQNIVESNKTTDLDNLGINVTLVRKSTANVMRPFNVTPNSSIKRRSINKCSNNKSSTSDTIQESTNDTIAYQRSDDLLAKLTYKVPNYVTNRM